MVFFSISRLLPPPPPHEFAKATFIRKTGALFVEGGLGRIDEAAWRLQFGRLLNIDRRIRSGDILPALKEMNGGWV
jgi:hypothetical protein